MESLERFSAVCHYRERILYAPKNIQQSQVHFQLQTLFDPVSSSLFHQRWNQHINVANGRNSQHMFNTTKKWRSTSIIWTTLRLVPDYFWCCCKRFCLITPYLICWVCVLLPVSFPSNAEQLLWGHSSHTHWIQVLQKAAIMGSWLSWGLDRDNDPSNDYRDHFVTLSSLTYKCWLLIYDRWQRQMPH